MIYHQIRIAMKPDALKDRVEYALELLRRLGRELDVVETGRSAAHAGVVPAWDDQQQRYTAFGRSTWSAQ